MSGGRLICKACDPNAINSNIKVGDGGNNSLLSTHFEEDVVNEIVKIPTGLDGNDKSI